MSLTQADLAQFTGTEHIYRHGMTSYLYTDGVRYLCEKAGAYWLLEMIAITTRYDPRIRADEMNVWTLTVEGTTGTLVCTDGNDVEYHKKEIHYTDFPLPEIKIWRCDQTFMLPSEY